MARYFLITFLILFSFSSFAIGKYTFTDLRIGFAWKPVPIRMTE